MSPQAWTAIWATAALIAVLGLLCFGPPAWEAMRAQQYRRETARIEGHTTVGREWHPVRRVHLLAALTAELAVAWVRRPLDRLKARNNRILDEREARRG